MGRAYCATSSIYVNFMVDEVLSHWIKMLPLQ